MTEMHLFLHIHEPHGVWVRTTGSGDVFFQQSNFWALGFNHPLNLISKKSQLSRKFQVVLGESIGFSPNANAQIPMPIDPSRPPPPALLCAPGYSVRAPGNCWAARHGVSVETAIDIYRLTLD